MSRFFRVIGACLVKDLKSMLTERAFLFQCVILPINYTLLLMLFALAGSNAPTAVVMNDTGLYAQQLYQALSDAHSFQLTEASPTQGSALLQAGEVVAVVTIPADFDARVTQGQLARIGLAVNNLNTDMTDDVRRGVRLAVTTFAEQTVPAQVPMVMQEQDQYPRDLDYISFLSISALVIGVMVGGLLQAGSSAAREWEHSTMPELLLSPAPRTAIVVGKMLAAMVVSLAASLISLLFVVLVIGDWPVSWGEALAWTTLSSGIFVAAGTLLGTVLRRRQTLTLLVRGCSVPLFFLSGIFAPLTFSTTGVQILARLFPVHYLLVLEQQAFFGFQMNTLGTWSNVLILAGFLVIFVSLAALTMCWRVAVQ
jgi:ABC-2 type transport system permease protein